MARARNIKPAFFTNEILGTVDPIVGMTFIGLWCLADKDGRLEDRPLRIKAELFPYREKTDVNGYLTVLERNGFIERYEVDGMRLIQVVNFQKHQSPHHTEKPKGLPSKPLNYNASGDLTVKPRLIDGDCPVPTRSDSLIPDSLIQEKEVKKQVRGCRLPSNTDLSDEWITAAKELRPEFDSANISRIFDEFKDYWLSKAGASASKVDWFLTWKNWIRKANSPKGVAQSAPAYVSPLTLIGGKRI